MKKILVLLTFTMYVFAASAQTATVDMDSVAAKIGAVKSISISNDTAIVVNLDNETFVLVGDNIGQLVMTLADGYDKLKEANPQKPLDYIVALLPWLLGGGITSVIAYATRAMNGLKAIFNGIEKDYKIVLGVAGALALGWNLIQGIPIATTEFWGTFAMEWLKFGGAAFVVYFTILRRFMKTPENPIALAKKVEEARSLLASQGIRVMS